MAAPHSSRRRRRPLAGAKERIDSAAYELFSRHGVRAVGVDTLAARAGVAKMTLYKHYPSKDELALAFLRRREELWTRSWLQQEVERRGGTPVEKLLAIFDAFDEWFRGADFEACAFIRALLEYAERRHPVRRAAVQHMENIRSYVRALARDAGVRDAHEFARLWQTLMAGSIVAASAGDPGAAQRTKQAAELLLARYRGKSK
jgi:AcrR family transcriptional regulator